MGYLTDNIPLGRNYALCQDLYSFRMVVQPGVLTDSKLSAIVKDEIPDVEEWQFSGRRRCPIVPSRGRAKGIRRVIHPSSWAFNSRRMRPFTEEVYFAFRTAAQQSQVAARMDAERISYTIHNTPNSGS